MGKRVGAVQSCYIPWKGYFDLVNSVDEFVLFDSVQYTRRDWRNRNAIKTPQGLRWLTVPVQTRGRRTQPICEARIVADNWRARHWQTLARNYARCAHFRACAPWLEALYEDDGETLLSRVNARFLKGICEYLDIRTPLSWSMDYPLEPGRTERLVSLCRALGADTYVSGPSARAYIDERLFAAEGIRVEYMDYAGYPEYAQIYPPFVHQVSVLDLILHEGPAARAHLHSVRGRK